MSESVQYSAVGSGEGRIRIYRQQSSVDVQWRDVFFRYDENSDGRISLSELRELLNDELFITGIPDHAVRRLMKSADHDESGYIEYKEFMKMVKSSQFQSLLKFYVARYVDTVVPKGAMEGAYEEEYTCKTFINSIAIISVIEIFFFIIDESLSENYVFGPVARLFIYNPYRRSEIWRWLTYMFVHVGTTHLIVNVVVQLLLGVPLEMVHGRRRMLAVYSSGVIFGALLTSVFDPVVFLAGASGGVYALLFAHIAAIFLNWSEMKYNTYQVMILTIIILYDFTVAVYYRYYNAGDDKTGYFAHIGGGIAGLLVGFCVLRNLNVLRWEKTVQRACLTIFIASVIIAVIINFTCKSCFLE
ncbi:protein rhomboid-like isoform X1 [Schistocerca nitens]|uniref:protein rhomboid-like isoform X1 n=1 Tax=Schistocerca nitens TaxID=7011 RepID=UPI00211941A0|nr:protein rhomboid-like isoform X1 [Schistocerca nitens]XP_049794249.1 protein rhomboid-like isoform X1 [Schistocerca nitens]